MQENTDETSDDSGGFVRSLARGLAVLKAFDRDDPTMTLSDVARKTGLSRAAAGRFLKTLVTLGYASFDGREYRLRPRVLELGMAYFGSHSFIDLANPILEAAAERAQEPCSMAVLDGDEIVYVARHTANRMMSISITIGKRYPAQYTSLGRVLLGGLPDAALDDFLDRAHDTDITGAAAKIALQCLFDHRDRGRGCTHPQRIKRHHETGRAEAALRAVEIDHRLLDGMKRAVGALEMLHRDDMAPVKRSQEADAGIHAFINEPAAIEPSDQHRAGAAIAFRATFLGAPQRPPQPQKIKQGLGRAHVLERDVLAIQDETDFRTHHLASPVG